MLKGKVFIVLLLLPFLFGCSNEKNKPQREVNIQKDEYDLIGRRITSIDSIVSDRKYGVVFVFNYYDCGNCVDLGFSVTKEIDSLYHERKVAVISTVGSSSFYQKRNAYYEYVYADSKDLIRKELKYIPTPIMILMDSLNTIRNYILPGTSDKKEIISFIESVEN